MEAGSDSAPWFVMGVLGNREVEEERHFLIEELFFSTTDKRGVIQTCNEVFVRISAYEDHELLEKPHNVIRHPDMPRAVFRLMWDRIKANKTIAAYVKNKAKDGKHYWVLAVVRPIADGYLSVRMKPSSQWFPQIEQLYKELRQIERDIENHGQTRAAGMDASTKRLEQFIEDLGFQDYDDLLRVCTADEMSARAQSIQGGVEFTSGRSRWGIALAANGRLAEKLRSNVDKVGEYLDVNATLLARSRQLKRFAEEGKTLALNAVISTGRLGSQAATLNSVADLMKQTFPQVIGHTTQVIDRVRAAGDFILESRYVVAPATLQNDACEQFLYELVSRPDDQKDSGQDSNYAVQVMVKGLMDDIHNMVEVLKRASAELEATNEASGVLFQQLMRLDSLERCGRMEAHRNPRGASFISLFNRTRTEIRAAMQQTRELQNVAASAAQALIQCEDLLTPANELDEAVA